MAEMSRKLKVQILLGLEGPGVDEAVKSIRNLSKSVAGLTDTAFKAGAAFVVFKGLKAAFDFGTQAVDQANLLERGFAGMSTVFKQLTPEMLEFVKGSTELGMSMAESAKAVTFIGSVLKQSGFAITEVAGMTKTLVSLGADLAFTYGYDVQEALLAMTALFRGEYDPIEKFGVAMKQNEIESIKASRGLEKLTGAAEIFADQQIRYELLLQRSTDAQGAYARNSDSLFVAQQNLAATFQNVQAIVGMQLTPVLANLALNMVPLVESLTPVLVGLFQSMIPVVQTLVQNKQQLVNIVVGGIKAFAIFIDVLAQLVVHVVENIDAYKALATALIIVGGLGRVFLVLREGALVAAAAVSWLGINVKNLTGRLKLLKFAIATTGFGLIAVAAGWVAGAVMEASENVKALEADINAFEDMNFDDYAASVGMATDANFEFAESADAVAGGAGAVRDAVGEFYSNLQNEIAKQQAKLTLQNLGASKGLIDLVLGSGEDWYAVFQEVTRNGMESVRQVQAMFRQTAAGFDEAMQEWQEEYDAFLQFKQQAEDARDAFIDFVKEFEILPTIERQLGRFEQAAATQLENIQEKLDDAFDNKYLLDNSYRQLSEYAKKEFAVLQEIERQRDEIMSRRDAAEALIKQVNDNIVSSGRLINALQEVGKETDRLDIASVVKRTVKEARTLREFEIIVTSAVIQPIDQIVSKSQQLVQGYRGIVERTRAFVSDMKALRDLGLDPTLFNDLVEAGVDAGGETARALVEGGTNTVSEVNSLFKELNALGAELGEETAQVMYGQGELFVDGIVKGLQAQAEQLEEQAKALALAFTSTFEAMLVAGIEAAIAAAEAALSRMPVWDGSGFVTPSDGDPVFDDDDDDNRLPTGLTEAQQRAIVADKIQGVRKVLTGQSVARQDAATAARLAAQIQPQRTVRISGTDVARGNVIYNVYAPKIDQRSLTSSLSRVQTNTGGTSSRSNTSLKPSSSGSGR